MHLKRKSSSLLLRLSLILITGLIVSSECSKDVRKRYRSKLVLNSNSSTTSTEKYNFQNETLSYVYPDPNLSSSRAMSLADFEQEALPLVEPRINEFSGSSDPWPGQWTGSGSSKYNAASDIYEYKKDASKYLRSSDERYGASSYSSLNPVVSSYPVGSGSGYYGNPILETYLERAKERERTAKELLASATAASKLNALASLNIHPYLAASSLVGNAVASPDYLGHGYADALASASGGGGWGWGGWGWKQDSQEYWKWVKSLKSGEKWKEEKHDEKKGASKINLNAFGLLGLLGLLSLLSNVILLLTTTTTTAAAGRRKRSVAEDMEESDAAKRERIFYQVLPYLSPVAHARDGILPPECVLQGVCLTNKALVKEYGLMGRPAGNRLTTAIANLLGEISVGKEHKKTIGLAGLHGRNQRNCQKAYPMCPSMQRKGPHSIPFTFRMEDVPMLYSKLKKSTSYTPKLL